MSKWLISQGHDVRVLNNRATDYGVREIYEIDGVTVFPVTGADSVQCNLFRWCDIVLTHLEYTAWTIHMSFTFKKPIVQIVHNDTPYHCITDSVKPVNIIYNSQWIADKLQYKHHSMVLVPPVDYRHYDVGGNPYKRPYVTLINCNENKGGKIFSEIAERMPDVNFLAVKGSYEEQFIPDLPNVKVHENTPYIKPIYEQTHILLMPSKYESWGMTATEAMANGIPVVCTRTPGLMENTAGKMVYCERDNIDEWVDAIRSLSKWPTYKKYSEAGRRRAQELDPLEGYKKLEPFLYVAV